MAIASDWPPTHHACYIPLSTIDSSALMLAQHRESVAVLVSVQLISQLYLKPSICVCNVYVPQPPEFPQLILHWQKITSCSWCKHQPADLALGVPQMYLYFGNVFPYLLFNCLLNLIQSLFFGGCHSKMSKPFYAHVFTAIFCNCVETFNCSIEATCPYIP